MPSPATIGPNTPRLLGRTPLRLPTHLVGTLGAWLIYALIRVFGRRRAPEEVPWLVGPVGVTYIGDTCYEETAKAEGLLLERNARDGGLVVVVDQGSRAGGERRTARATRSLYEARDWVDNLPLHHGGLTRL